MLNFNDFCKNFIVMELPKLNGELCVLCNLEQYITKNIKNIVLSSYGEFTCKTLLFNWWDEVLCYLQGELLEYNTNVYSPVHNPVEFLCCLVTQGITTIIKQCNFSNTQQQLNVYTINYVLKQVQNNNVNINNFFLN